MAQTNPIPVLLIESDAKDAAGIPKILQECPDPVFTVSAVSGLDGAEKTLAAFRPEVILLSLTGSSEKNILSIRTLHDMAPRVPVIALADTKDEEAALKAVREGAQDYLIKNEINPRMLSRVIRYAISRKLSEEKIRNAFGQIETLLAALPSILIGVGPGGKVTHWNTVAETVFGLRAEEIVKKLLKDSGLRWDLKKIEKAIDESMKSRTNARLDDVVFIKQGKERIIGFNMIPILGSGPEDSYVLLFGADITERKNLENMKDEFVSTVSHELRTPLSMIREGVALVLDGILGQVTSEQKQFLSLSLENLDRLTRIINDLLDMSKIEASKMKIRREKINLNELAKKMEESFAPSIRGKDVQLRCKLPPQPVEIEADPDKLTQVFTNLLQNAVKFTEKGSIEISVAGRADEIECRISDTGCGIAQEDLPKVFSKFQQFGRTHGAGAKGTGLGLSICKGLVELHGGKIWVESTLGKGTQFIFTLPKH